MALLPVAGMKIYIGTAAMEPTSVDFVASDFSAVTWTLIDGWANAGPMGDTANLISTPLINRGRDAHQKGTASAPSQAHQFAVIAGDAGQTALIAAAQASNKSNYPFRVDGSESGVTTVSKRYYTGLVMSASETGGGANTIQMINATVQPTSNKVSVPAVP